MAPNNPPCTRNSRLINRLQEHAIAVRSEATAQVLCDAETRIIELERACGAAAIAFALDILKSGVSLSALRGTDSAARMTIEGVGIDLDDDDDLIRFRNEYMARFKPTQEGAK